MGMGASGSYTQLKDVLITSKQEFRLDLARTRLAMLLYCVARRF